MPLHFSRSSALSVLLLVACAHAQPPVGREYPHDPPTYVELIDADQAVVWSRIHELLAKYHLEIQEERHSESSGYIFCAPFTVVLPGMVNLVDYHLGEIVPPREHEMLVERYRLEIYVSSTKTRLVRVWTDASISLDGYAPGVVRLPNLAGANLLAEIVAPIHAVKQWRRERVHLTDAE